MRGIAWSWVCFRLVQLPNYHPTACTFRIEIAAKRWHLEQHVSVVKSWLSFWLFTTLSTCQLKPNSLFCAHSSCTCTKVFIGFALCLMPKICPAYRQPYSLTSCQLFFSEQVIVTSAALICVVAFCTAPPIGGLSCFYLLISTMLIHLQHLHILCQWFPTFQQPRSFLRIFWSFAVLQFSFSLKVAHSSSEICTITWNAIG